MAEEVKRCPHGTAIPMSVYSMTRPEPSHDDHGWPSSPDPGEMSRRVAELRRLQEDAAVWPWTGGERGVYVWIAP